MYELAKFRFFESVDMQQKVTINLQPVDKKIEVIRGTPLIDVLHEYGVEFPCGGKGTCGRCKVRLTDGELKTDALQKQKLEKLGLEDNWRLACFCKADSDITLEISQFENIILLHLVLSVHTKSKKNDNVCFIKLFIAGYYFIL